VIDKLREKINWVKSSDFLPGLALFFASLFFFYDLFDGRYLLTERDLGPYFIPPRFFWVESIKNLDFPLWNPFQFSGHPFFANPQHAILYPFNGLFFLLPFDVAFNAIIILHFFLGGLFTYFFLKDLKVNSTGSLISGLIFMLSGYLLSVHSLLNTLLSVTWTPLIMLFFRRAIANSGLKNEILTGIFITISFLGGGIEIVYGNFFILLFMMIFSFQVEGHIVKNRVEEPLCGLLKRIIFFRLGSLLIILTFFLFLSAIQLIPFLELWMHSIRGQGISYQEATTWSFAPKEILLFFLPDAYGYFLDMKKYWIDQCWFKTLYTGGLPFTLSAIFFVFGKNRRLFFSLMLFSLFLSLGRYNPLYAFVFKYVPFFNGLRYPVKFLYIFILILSITAGLGFQRLTEFLKEGEGKRIKNIFIISSLASGLLLLLSVINHNGIEQFLKWRGIDFPDFNHLSVNLHHAKRFLFYLALFFLLLRIGYGVKWKVWIKVLLVFFLIADLFGNMGFYGKEKSLDYFRRTKILEMISSDERGFRIFSTAKTTSFDTPILIAEASPLNILKEKHLPSMNLLYRLHNIWGIDVIHLKRADDLYKAFTSTPSISTTNLTDLYGVKYVISITPIEDNHRFEMIYARLEGLRGEKEELLKGNTIKLYKNRKALPRSWLVKNFQVLDQKSIVAKLASKEFDPRKEVLLEEEPPHLYPVELKNLLHRGEERGVEFVSETNNRLGLLVETKENNLLVLSDTYFPGWKVFVDGREEKIFRGNYNFRAVPLTPGTHRVEFVYDPWSFKLGAGITFLGIMGFLGLALVAGRNKR